ncbi:hypothetical protein MINT15_37140 [Saccharomonospora viridis]|uniref:Uncharacterized protein n=1 Tax=Saccharomonospora viridis TaxID=1852 RepID=A0A837D7U4_9PSEU|nr:hypothetical protein MINT15_37140 [Saccharomonospora viridis]
MSVNSSVQGTDVAGTGDENDPRGWSFGPSGVLRGAAKS